jgi:aminopeptidase N
MKKHFWFRISGFGFLVILLAVSTSSCNAQPLSQKDSFTRADTLRGTITPERAWWDVLRYDIGVTPDYATKSIAGSIDIKYKKIKPGPGSKQIMQIDLQEPMILDSAILLYGEFTGKQEKSDAKPGSLQHKLENRIAHGNIWTSAGKLNFKREGNVYFIETNDNLSSEPTRMLKLYFHGTPRAARNAPWDGGWIWKKDDLGRPWMSVACQGLGASVWYPCKDHQSDEPDNGASLTVTVPDTLVAVANGRLKNKRGSEGFASYTWEVNNPINNYNIVPYIGKYVSFSDTAMGEKGKLDLEYWVLDYNLEKAKKQFMQVKPMIRAFEYWFGPYPFYEDGYKLVESPHLGMEHQSAIAYGNKYRNGYLGRDLSGTGHGLKWDFIIVHESGHEWFANNITTKDIADMWVHEGFTNYSETLFTDYHYGKKAGNEYVQGLRRSIENDIPIIGHYGVNQEGSNDMYYKGANLLHNIRQIINNDKKFREILRGLNKDFYHKTVTSKEVEQYISKKSGKDFSKVFDQYLRTTQIPELQLEAEGDKIKYKWVNSIPGFNMPVKLSNGLWITPTTKEQKLKVKDATSVTVDPNFYVLLNKYKKTF